MPSREKSSKYWYFLIFIVVLCVFGIHSFAQAAEVKPLFFFMRDLQEGVTGDDVKELQKFLNKDPDTRLPGTGIGSQGQESTFFGKNTKESVIKFQNKYKDEVLRPVGLTSGTGKVGLWTRLKLNQILINAQISQTPSKEQLKNLENEPSTEDLVVDEQVSVSNTALNSLVSPPRASNSKDLALSSLSKYYGKPGAVITLGGTGFSKENTVRLGSQKYEKLTSSGTSIRFTIPDSINPGKYEISVISGGKTSNALPFMVTAPNAVPPIVTKIEPREARFGQEIKIFGQNFTSTDNIVSSHLGIISDLSSMDGTTLSFSVPVPDYMTDPTKWFGDKDNLYWPVRVYVINENGISKPSSAASFIINR
ncbi:MAG TPA: IPT/TIG domain-containing protein [Candidatus Nanoarchaeia archaeon]|nr:IPT/TIG domain-containing protein [Candidatus Nanoarchaeia archaeon]